MYNSIKSYIIPYLLLRKQLNYLEFMNYLKKYSLTVKEIEKELGYSQKSIFNNWKKNNFVPEKALISIKMYLTIKEQKETINKLLKNEINNCINLSENVHKIAKDKSIRNNITIEDYITSLIISKI